MMRRLMPTAKTTVPRHMTSRNKALANPAIRRRHIVAICHGPAALLALSATGNAGDFPFAGYTIAAFPDASDRMIPDIGYMPGHLTWQFGEKLKALGMTIANSEPDDSTHKDRKLLTGAGPLAANALGKLAAETLLAEVAAG